MTIISAIEANQKSKKNAQQSILDVINDKIIKACDNGKFSILIYKKELPTQNEECITSALATLNQKGYYTHDGETFFHILWYEPEQY